MESNRVLSGIARCTVIAALLLSTAALEAKKLATPPAPRGQTEVTPDDPKAWVARYRSFAAQKTIPQDFGYGESASMPAGTQTLRDVLRHLPPPPDWPKVRDALVAAAKTANDAERTQLEAGAWLIGYLMGNRGGLAAAIRERAASIEDEMSVQRYAYENLLQSLDSGPDDEGEQQMVEWFEQQVAMFEPLNEAEVKAALGGEANFKRLARMMDHMRKYQERTRELYAEFEKNRDEAAIAKKFEALQTETEAALAADQEALAPYTELPKVRAYIAQRMGSQGLEEMKTLQIPKLITAVGAAKAEALLRRALATELALHPIEEDDDGTGALARKLALELGDKVKAPQWMLTLDWEAGKLFAAIDRRFPLLKATPTSETQFAAGFEVARLIRSDRVKEAVALALALPRPPGAGEDFVFPYSVATELEKKQPAALWEFHRSWLTAHPAAAWDSFTQLSVANDKRDELRAMVRKLSEQKDLSPAARQRVDELQASTDLAVGEVGAARKRLRNLIQPVANDAARRTQQIEIGRRLLILAYLENDNAGLAEDLKRVETLLGAPWQKKELSQQFTALSSIATALNSVQRHADAQRIAAEALALVPKPADVPKPGDEEAERNHELSSYSINEALFESLRALVQLERWDDARKLLATNPHWEHADVAGLLDDTVSSSRQPVGWYIATVLAQKDPKAARELLAAQLVEKPSVDRVYRDYLKLAGSEADDLLQKLEASDRYEERPLIWRARLIIDAGKLDEAQAMLERAVAIDPSDGEQGRGDRMRVYAYLGEVMEKKKDAEKAAFFKGVMAAIRQSEDADRWYDAGVYARAIDMYRSSLTHFQDAYCIQSRLAIRLASEGRWNEAEAHFRRAFELMPDSFGRVESHCFGCEQVFEGEKSQEVAEGVFARLLAKQPDRPQLHYLFGYLREEQGRYADAAKAYRRAVELDPLYLNAWNRLAGLSEQIDLKGRELDDVILKLVELDPAGRHFSASLVEVGDIARLWETLGRNHEALNQLPRPAKIHALTAAAARIEGIPPEQRTSWSFSRRPTDPASVIMQHNFVQGIQGFLLALKHDPASE